MAEKLETIVKLGMANSRMRDYYDLLTIFRLYKIEDALLAEAIAATFRRRKTPLPENLPVGLSEGFGRDPIAMSRWVAFIQRLQIKDAPQDFVNVVKKVKIRAWPVISIARNLSGEGS